MDKFTSKSDLYIKTDVELQIAFRIATEQLSSWDAEKVKSAKAALKEIKAIQRSRHP